MAGTKCSNSNQEIVLQLDRLQVVMNDSKKTFAVDAPMKNSTETATCLKSIHKTGLLA